MNKPLHYRVFAFGVVWTLGLLWLGSVVHATGSSLACPDWPTCFGSMTPEMTGGVFWEHLHRLVAGGLILIFLLGTLLAWRPEAHRPWIRRWCLIGLGGLLLQAVLGGLTVIFRLPTAVSTAHLALALAFLALLVVLTVATRPGHESRLEPDPIRAGWVRSASLALAALVFGQSVVGAGVRHTQAGMACPDIPLCLGEVIPPFANGLIVLHFGHRVLGYVVLVAALWVGWAVRRQTESRPLRTLLGLTATLVVAQVGLGFASVYTSLGVTPVSLHTLVAATILSLLVSAAALTWRSAPSNVRSTEGAPPTAATHGG